MSLYSTVSQGRLHVAYEEKYQGSINSYNNFLTRFFTWISGKSMTIFVNGKEKCVNKNSYLTFLNTLSIQVHTIQNLKKYTVLNSIQFTPLTNKGLMSRHISPLRRERKGEKLVRAIFNHDFAGAEYLLGKGASSNKHFWMRQDNRKLYFTYDLRSELPHKKVYAFRAENQTPLLYAAKNGHAHFIPILLKFGADTSATGETATFSREIMDVRNHTNFSPTLHTDYVWMHTRHSCYPRTRAVYRAGVDLVNSQVIEFKDTYHKINTLVFNPANYSIRELPSNEPIREFNWQSSQETSRIGFY